LFITFSIKIVSRYTIEHKNDLYDILLTENNF